jgi:hypothetical protein
MNPLKTMPMSRIAARVMNAISGCWAKLSLATGARLRPIRATIAPVTTGGISHSMTRELVRSTSSPMRKNSTPQTTIPPRAAGMPPSALAAITGAMKAKLDPR